jgi:HSP20 family protein
MSDKRSSFGGLLGGLGGLIEKLADLAEKAEQLKKEGKDGEDIKIVSGFTIRTGLKKDSDASDIKIEPFGNVKKDKETGKTVVHEVREPLVDVFDESDHVLVVAELPGVAQEDVTLQLSGDLLTLEAARGEKKYQKEIQLPQTLDAAKMTHTCHNGVLEIRIGK